MYCPQCGKQIDDESRFCYMCGARIAVRSKETEPAEPKKASPNSAKNKIGTPSRDDGIRFTPLFEGRNVDPSDYDGLGEDEEAYRPSLTRAAQEKNDRMPRQEPRRRPLPESGEEDEAPYLDASDDMPYEDEYDTYDEPEEDRFDVGEYEYEEPEKQSFLVRYAAPLVTTVLIAAIIVVGLFYLKTDGGQQLMGKFGMAQSAETYAQLGTDAYKNKDYAKAGDYFDKALSMDGENYDYAYRGAVSYYHGEDLEKATAMIRQAIALQPDNPEPYKALFLMYPDPNTRTLDINMLLQDGYERTGDAGILGMKEVTDE